MRMSMSDPGRGIRMGAAGSAAAAFTSCPEVAVDRPGAGVRMA
jgi:hypothetical protein